MKNKFLYTLGLLAIFSTGCSDILDRPSLTTAEDDTFWTSAEKVNIYVNDIYPSYFVGYGTGWDQSGVPGFFTFNDDMVTKSTQGAFGRTVPNETGWSFKYVRKINILLEKLEMMKEKNLLSDAEYNHWKGIGRFFRGWEYADLTRVYGDVPFYDHVLKESDIEELFKDRDKRNDVFDRVLDDFDFAIDNIRVDDGGHTRLNLYSACTIISRVVMIEASYQRYYYKNEERAKELFSYAADIARIVMDSGMFKFDTDFRSLFGTVGAIKGKEVIMERRYSTELNTTHCAASYCNMQEGWTTGANLDFIKSFICTDGETWNNSSLENTDQFDIQHLIPTRDSRFEASFYPKATPMNHATNLYCVKFISRKGLDYLKTVGASPEMQWKSSDNANSYPVVRYAETVLNYIECKAEIEDMGGEAVSQEDLDATINAIRNRPIAPEAEALGVKKTAPLELGNLPNDPNRDKSVSPLLWEIRRERRMEFFNEPISRINDLKRWHKLEYMDTDTRPDLLKGMWVNVAVETPEELVDKAGENNLNKLRVIQEDGTEVIFNGDNGDQLVGYYCPVEIKGRIPYLDLPNVNLYLSPMGLNTMNFYKDRGYVLTQTEGWPEEQ